MYFTRFFVLVSSLLLLLLSQSKKQREKNLSQIKINQFLIFRQIKIEKTREIQFHEIFASFLKIYYNRFKFQVPIFFKTVLLAVLVLNMIKKCESRECDTAMMLKCCGHWHVLRHFATYRDSLAYLKERHESEGCPKWFRIKCRCYHG